VFLKDLLAGSKFLPQQSLVTQGATTFGLRAWSGRWASSKTCRSMIAATFEITQSEIFWSDGDFRSLVEAMQRRGVCATLVSTILIQPR
jgi:hypothetical protein